MRTSPAWDVLATCTLTAYDVVALTNWSTVPSASRLEDAHHPVARGVGLLEVGQWRLAWVEAVVVQPPQQGRLHLGRRRAILRVDVVRLGVDVVVHGACDARHVRRLGDVVRTHARVPAGEGV